MELDSMKCYKTLDLAPGTSAAEIRKAYLELCHVWDPEKYPDNLVLRQRAENRRREIEEAYNGLRAFLPELNAPAGEQPEVIKEMIRKDLDMLEFNDRWSARRVLLILIIAVALVGIFWLGAEILQRLVMHGNIRF
jgi:preprotein translocase subunit Sec63